eukprot:582125-Amphidinium_carterae.3
MLDTTIIDQYFTQYNGEHKEQLNEPLQPPSEDVEPIQPPPGLEPPSQFVHPTSKAMAKPAGYSSTVAQLDETEPTRELKLENNEDNLI